MENSYAKVVIKGSPISKSNFKLFNVNGRAILPYNSGKYHDRYAHYEEEIAYEARIQNPNLVMTESLIAVLKVFYKSKKRHPDTNNITKSIFDGIEKSGLIINDAQVRRIIIEESYDAINPRFELELFAESTYTMNFVIKRKEKADPPIEYDLPSNKKNVSMKKPKKTAVAAAGDSICEICGKAITKGQSVSANNGKTTICKNCLKKLL